MNRKKYNFWKKIKDFCTKKMEDAWFEGGNCDSACPNCKQWESHGNKITTESQDDGLEIRKCVNCGHTWRAVFTPAGFVKVVT